MNSNPGLLKYSVCPGNNCNVVRRCMELRHDRWEETSTFDKLYNFKWQQLSRGISYDLVNSCGTR
jgi:hypothetical protein